MTTAFVSLLLVAAFGSGRLFQWARDARNIMGAPGRHNTDRP